MLVVEGNFVLETVFCRSVVLATLLALWGLVPQAGTEPGLLVVRMPLDCQEVPWKQFIPFSLSFFLFFFFTIKVIQHSGSFEKEENRISFILTHLTHTFADKRPSSQSYGFSSSHVWM